MRQFLRSTALILAACLLLSCGSSPPAPSEPAAAKPETSKYEGKLVRRPGHTAEHAKVFVVQNGKRRWILDSGWLGRNGYKWPDDVQTIPAIDLEAIPMGEPVQ